MITDKHFSELEEKGYTVVENVISKQECNQAVREYQEWLANFGDKFPKSYNSIIRDYNTCHLETTWRLRLRAKPVFAQLWKTDKLHTSFDAIAIGRPPEDGKEDFQLPGKTWLHADFTASRNGLHAYEGALCLEEQTKNDWTFQVIDGSHKYMNEHLGNCPAKAESSITAGFYKLQPDDIDFLRQRKCRLTRVSVGKGGMLLWDSRLAWENVRPLPNRKAAGRWRFLTFVSMTPAIWASDLDIRVHQEAYTKPALTNHWSSQGVRIRESHESPGIPFPRTVPDIARTKESMKLSAMLPYDFEDGLPNGPDFTPVWKKYKHNLPAELDVEAQFANGHI